MWQCSPTLDTKKHSDMAYTLFILIASSLNCFFINEVYCDYDCLCNYKAKASVFRSVSLHIYVCQTVRSARNILCKAMDLKSELFKVFYYYCITQVCKNDLGK